MDSNNKTFDGEYVSYNQDDLDFLIYNDLPLTDMFYKEDNTYKNLMKKLMFEGEEFAQIPQLTSEYFITSFGRIINAKRTIQMTVTHVLNDYLVFNCKATRWLIEPLMEENGWKFDKDIVLKFYDEVDYPMRNKKN